MADFVVLLQTAIGAMPFGAASRGVVYSRARNALLGELRTAKLAPHEITKQRLLLEQAIRDVERAAVDEWKETGQGPSPASLPVPHSAA